jgi:hypothetical protein
MKKQRNVKVIYIYLNLGSLKAEWGPTDVWGLGVTHFPRPFTPTAVGQKHKKQTENLPKEKYKHLKKERIYKKNKCGIRHIAAACISSPTQQMCVNKLQMECGWLQTLCDSALDPLGYKLNYTAVVCPLASCTSAKQSE